MYEEHLLVLIQGFHCDILGTLKWLAGEGVLELVTSAATHGFLPLLECDSSVQSQVRLGVEAFHRHFSRDPRGFWLPECAYRPAQWSARLGYEPRGIDQWLAQEGVQYFLVEGVGIARGRLRDGRDGQPTTPRGYHLDSGVAVFGRNQATDEQVWPPQKGYPGDPCYLEFHQKDPQSGLRYWRVTGRPDKQVYDPMAAAVAVADQARHFHHHQRFRKLL